MTREEAESIIEAAIDQLVQNDSELLDLGVTERALSHRLAHFMQLSRLVRPPLVVDCEYNRHFDEPKRLRLPPRKALDREARATTVFPDIVVHQRNSDERNLIVLELKKPGEDVDYDELKLRAFREELGYLHAAHVILGRTADGTLVRRIEWRDD